MIYQIWSMIGECEALATTVAVEGAGTVESEAQAAIGEAIAALESAGFQSGEIVRSRLYAVDSIARQAASDVRRVALAGALRGASSSFSDPARIPAGARVIIDLMAVRSATATAKHVCEYDPPIAPPMFVTIDGLVFLSGNTDTAADFATQVKNIRAKIDASLATAGSSIGRSVSVSAFVARSIGLERARRSIAAEFPELACPIVMTLVDGFSAAEKRIEIEITAKLG